LVCQSIESAHQAGAKPLSAVGFERFNPVENRCATVQYDPTYGRSLTRFISKTKHRSPMIYG
jgi:hypothetical protein